MPEARPPRLLIVDDEYVIRELLSVELEARGYSVAAASHGEEALELARREPFDAAVCDVQMPGMLGPQVVAELKAAQPGLEVVMVTAHASVETAIESMKKGAYDYIAKPINFEELARILERALEKRRLQKDLSAEQALRKELQAAYEQLREVERLKDSFVSTVSHELRTPLAIVLEGLDLMGSVKPEQIPEVAVRVKSGALRLHEKIEALLTFSDLQKGDLPIVPSKVDLRELCAEVVELYENQWKPKEITLQIDFPEGFPLAWADEARITEVLKHLILNAIQFNVPGGSIRISGTVSDYTLDVSVADSGPGIPYEALPKVFDAFYQAAEYMTRQTGGLGLGLAIVKRIVDAHRGSIVAESKPGQGTVFRFSLPRHHETA